MICRHPPWKIPAVYIYRILQGGVPRQVIAKKAVAWSLFLNNACVSPSNPRNCAFATVASYSSWYLLQLSSLDPLYGIRSSVRGSTA